MDCLSTADLLRIAEGSAPPTGAAALHVADCERCAAALDDARRLVDDVGEAAQVVPEGWRAAAVAIEAAPPATSIEARPLTASELGEPEVVRGGVAALPSAWRAADFEIDTAHLPSGALVGQVHGADADVPPGYCILYGGGDARSCPLGPTGEFRFPDVGAGRYTLVVETRGHRLVVRDLVLETPR